MIHPDKIVAILRKDLVDAMRQGRIVVILMTPLLLAVFYNFAFRDERRPEVKAVYAAPDGPAVMERLRTRVEPVIDLKLQAVADADSARAAIVERRADIAFVLPADLERGIREGATPGVTVLVESGSTARELLTGTLGSVFREIAGQRTPANVRTEIVERPGSDPILIVQLGPRPYFVLSSLVMVVGMIAIIVVPMILAEESEKRTLDALLMVGSIGDVMLAKALVGLVFIALSAALVLAVTRLPVRDPMSVALGIGGLAIALTGFGLFLGVVFRDVMQVSTWSGFLVLPTVLPAFIGGIPLPTGIDVAVRSLPSAQAQRLIANGLGPAPLYGDAALSVAVIAGWGVLAYALLAWRLARREA